MTDELEAVEAIPLDKHLCGCGTVRDALDIVAKELKQQVLGEDCVIWNYVVGAMIVMASLQIEKLVLEDTGKEDKIPQTDKRYIDCLKVAKMVSEDSGCLRYLVEKLGVETEDIPDAKQQH